MDPVLISLVSALTALVASVVGPIVTVAVAKRQITASVVSSNRHRWISELGGVARGVERHQRITDAFKACVL